LLDYGRGYIVNQVFIYDHSPNGFQHPVLQGILGAAFNYQNMSENSQYANSMGTSCINNKG
jgi:hypothetical protein